ncbi:class I SAM-dependent methyltransferase [Spiribacter roseus]|uniref:Methyltransferase domain-containing protein n=1 Tax=Spiribacter roseus TaxID=1855875 RepID=A0ABV3RZQ5_9GAMM
MSELNEKTKKYWDNFYEKERLGVEDIPSQFAAFVLSEFSGRKTVIDVGCGNGRDSFFFARHVPKVIGIDASKSAIESCHKKREHIGFGNAEFHQVDLSSLDYCLWFFESVSAELENSVVYARFFLHAIDEEAEENFLKLAKFVSERGGAVAAEFRTHRDEQQQKETSAHFRRYINPLEFMENARSAGLSLSYFTEGFGLAKYKSDDAHVARFLFRADS